MHPRPESMQGDDLEFAVDAAIAACDGDMRAAIRRVRANLSYLARNERVTKTGNRMTARWSIRDDSV